MATNSNAGTSSSTSSRATQYDQPTPGEAELITKLIPVLKALIEKEYRDGTTYRDTHAKGHAAVQATFTVERDLPPELAVGLFATPRTYPAWVRLSNLNPVPQEDKKKDVRAFAIKLMGVEGETIYDPAAHNLDFILMSSAAFLAPNLQKFYDMEVALLKGGFAMIWFFLTHPRMALTILQGLQKTANLLEIPFYSQTAYAFGDQIVQYHLQPHQAATSQLPDNPTPNYLRERLAADLARTPAAFDFMVQLQTDPRKMPVDNPMVVWDPSLSPYRKVATIHIPVQRFDSPPQVEFCESFSVNAWRTLPPHRPLGDINRARLRVYPEIAQFRHQRNNVVWREPRPGDPNFATS